MGQVRIAARVGHLLQGQRASLQQRPGAVDAPRAVARAEAPPRDTLAEPPTAVEGANTIQVRQTDVAGNVSAPDRKSTRLNSSHNVASR